MLNVAGIKFAPLLVSTSTWHRCYGMAFLARPAGLPRTSESVQSGGGWRLCQLTVDSSRPRNPYHSSITQVEPEDPLRPSLRVLVALLAHTSYHPTLLARCDEYCLVTKSHAPLANGTRTV